MKMTRKTLLRVLGSTGGAMLKASALCSGCDDLGVESTDRVVMFKYNETQKVRATPELRVETRQVPQLVMYHGQRNTRSGEGHMKRKNRQADGIVTESSSVAASSCQQRDGFPLRRNS